MGVIQHRQYRRRFLQLIAHHCLELGLSGFIGTWGVQQGQCSMAIIHSRQVAKLNFNYRKLMNLFIGFERKFDIQRGCQTHQVIQRGEAGENFSFTSVAIF
ncbi:Uncharacterised protein [Enterobacter hormaechei]|nr:Uncharacterised protein [Enterobacter hormaechei]